MKKKSLLMLFFVIMLLTACGKNESQTTEQKAPASNEIYIYYLNHERTDLYPEKLKIEKDLSDNISHIIKALDEPEEEEQYDSPIPESILYKGWTHGQRKGNIELRFDVNYDSLKAEDLLFFKACVVKSVLNLSDVSTVTLYLTDLASADKEKATVSESFDADSFNLSFADENGYTQQGSIIVYFASLDGMVLKEYRKTVEISNTTSLPKLVVETLIAGPEDTEEYQSTIPPDTKLQKISVKDGVCYVDLSEEFYDSKNTLQNDIIVYSIVNSLVELPNVAKVQFLENGEKVAMYRDSFAFDGTFERNLDLVEKE